MSHVGDFDYIPCGCSGGGSPGTPIVQNVSPVLGTLLNPFDTVMFDVIDVDSILKRVIVYISYPNLGIMEAVFTSTGYCPLFIANSTATVIPFGFRYKINRSEPWPDSLINMTVDAIDSSGQED